MQKFKIWLNTNKVFLFGLAQFVFTSLNEIFTSTDSAYSAWIVGYSAVIAVCTYLGRNLRGQWASIFSAVLPTIYVVGSLHDQHAHITLGIIATKIVFPLFGAVVGIFYTSPPKDRGYEKTEAIVEAKVEGKAITEAKKSV